jgi:hypothetical protein
MFEFVVPELLDNSIERAIDKASEVYSESILDVIAEQPGDWTPKSEGWTQRSGSSDLFYGETGQFVMAVATPGANQRGVRAKRGDKRIFVGARYDVMHHSGFSMADIAGILQSTPDGSRDLFGRAYERVEDELNNIYKSVGIELK